MSAQIETELDSAEEDESGEKRRNGKALARFGSTASSMIRISDEHIRAMTEFLLTLTRLDRHPKLSNGIPHVLREYNDEGRAETPDLVTQRESANMSRSSTLGSRRNTQTALSYLVRSTSSPVNSPPVADGIHKSKGLDPHENGFDDLPTSMQARRGILNQMDMRSPRSLRRAKSTVRISHDGFISLMALHPRVCLEADLSLLILASLPRKYLSRLSKPF